jgi:leucyl aminopeptidase (aminopeptidase T)
MNYKQEEETVLYTEKEMEERYALSIGRIRELAMDAELEAPYDDYFRTMALFLLKMDGLYHWIREGLHREEKEEGLEVWNQELYGDILPEHYEESYANPEYAVKKLGEEFGRIFSFLYTELRAEIVYAYEQRPFDLVITNELFLEVHSLMREEPSYRKIRDAIYWFVSDYSEITVMDRIAEQVDPKRDFATKIVMESDFSDLRYLYYYGEYISENEKKMAEFLNTLPQEKIDSLAFPYTDGFREGFELAGIDLSKKKTVNIRYPIGMERVVRAAIKQFEKMGLTPVIYRSAVASIHKRQNIRVGYVATSPNRQYDYDHRFDSGIYLDKAFIDRKLQNLKKAYESYREEASVFAGPACMETFGEHLFSPVNKEAAYRLTEKQQKLSVEYAAESSKITNEYILPQERSFTIIAYPMPEIGDNFPEIFKEIVKVNTLDKNQYRNIQQNLIDALDQAEQVKITGRGENETDLIVSLAKLNHPEKETLFENCLADVNIPVGEVFTSPRLSGTNGVLHVTGVYLNELYYENLKLTFQDGKITDYSCTNFAEEEKNRAFIKENVLYHHETLPMGEFAIGTNTTAYQMAKDYKIEEKLPILIAEKMGPHFAVGDTCYSHAEENQVYNPDGKEIIAKENECSLLRFEKEGEAYFHCHTDITIPYDELGSITAITKDGREIRLIEQGRFVLPGTEELNLAFRD